MGYPQDCTTGRDCPGRAEDCAALLDTAGVAAVRCLLDGDLTILWAGEGFARAAGYSGGEFQARFPSLRAYCADYPEHFAAILGGTGEGRAVPLPRRDGTAAWASVSLTAAGEVDGTPAAWAVFTDVTGLVRSREACAAVCEEKARSFAWMMDAYEGNIYISDLETYELLYLNKTACQTLGKPLSELKGRKCYEVIQGRDSPCPFCTNGRLREDEFYEWEFFNPVLDRKFLIKNRIIHWEGHRSRIELSHDMYSEAYKLEKKDRERDALLRTIPGGFARVDARDMRTVLWYGGRFLSLIGYTREQFQTELNAQCTYVHPDDMERVIAVMGKSKDAGGAVVAEGRIVTRGGDIKILTMTFCYVSGEDSWDGIPSFYSVGIDVTGDRMEQERQRGALEDAYQAARVASEAKTNFLSSMSHDIRTPMNAILGMAAIAQTQLDEPERVRECLNKINVSSRHLLSLINEVLDMSKIESGKIDLAPGLLELPELLQDVMDICRPLVEEKNQDLQLSAGRIRHERVVADGDRLQQVLMNLLSNAIKYTPEGGSISLRINELPSALPGRGQFEFILTDTGIGMSEEFLPHIFEPFSRAEDTRINKIQGTGLGMTITENIVRMMNGTIDVKSKPGEGSRFVVSIPLELHLEEEACDEELAGLPVLVVDDDEVVCENAAALLDELGMRGSWVRSGEEAVRSVSEAHARAEDFFAVILDWRMPGMDGLATLRAIRGELGADVPVIIVSAYDYSSIEEAFVRAGADAFITKPLFKSKILHVLRLFCASGRLDAASAVAKAWHPGLRGKRVLLAEDNDLNREIVVELLGMQGVLVDGVENGRLAVEAFRNAPYGYYSAVLMDIQMPEMDGYEATAAIRALAREDGGSVPILALTANAFAADVGRARGAGMNDHIAKPIDVERLIEALEFWTA